MTRSRVAWGFGAAFALFVVVACSGSNSANGGPAPGSALCGVNGTNQCGNGRQCDPTLGCVECLSNTDCPASSKFCIRGHCDVCQSNADCGTGATPACWPADHQCHPACTGNAQCLPQLGTTCDTSSGDCIGCKQASDCAQPVPICDSVTQTCVQCAKDSDCPTGSPFCLVSRGQCVQCLNNSNCGASAPVCDPEGFRCRVGCTASSQCQAPVPVCDTTISACVQCTTNNDCGNTSTKYCLKDHCVQCASNSDCTSFASTPVCSTDNGACVQCNLDSDCTTAGTKCRGHVCR
jgi:Cys-rich repeat protein